MRGRRRVLLVKPPRFKWEDDDNNKTIYIYDAGKKYYEGNAELIGKENYGDDGNEISADELTPNEKAGGGDYEDEEEIQQAYVKTGFDWWREDLGGDGDEEGAYSDDGFSDEPTGIELSNPPEENDIDMKDANYIIDLEEDIDDPMKTTLRVSGGYIDGYEPDLENAPWIKKFKEFTTEGQEREALFSELVEEILSGEVDEIVRANILREMGVIDSKKQPKMGSGQGKKKKAPKFNVVKKELTDAQREALRQARIKRAEAIKKRKEQSE